MTKSPKTFTDALPAVMQGADRDKVADVIFAAVDVIPAPTREKKVTISSVASGLLMDATLSYDAIVDLIHAKFKGANTSARSIASIAARLRKTGVDVPSRRKAKPTIA